MTTTPDLVQLLRKHPFLDRLPEEYYEFIAGNAELREYSEGEHLVQQNHRANLFFLVLEGRISLQAHLPAQGVMPIETVRAPTAVGWSWLVAPYKWHFEATARTDVRTIAVRTPGVFERIEKDPAFGYEIYKRFMYLIVDRLHGAQWQMMDVYAKPEQSLL